MIIILYIVLVWWFINSIVYIWPREPVKAAPVRITPEPVKVPEPLQPEPPKIKPYTPEPNPERERLEKIAAGLLAAADENINYNIFYKVHNASDNELKLIIADYYINK